MLKNEARSYLTIQYQDPDTDLHVWRPSNEGPGINKDGVTDQDVSVWLAFVAYLNLARQQKYRLVRVEVATKETVITNV